MAAVCAGSRLPHVLRDPTELIDDVEFAYHFGFAWWPDGRTIEFSRFLYPSANNGIWRKTLGRPGLTRVLAGDDWQVVDWARK